MPAICLYIATGVVVLTLWERLQPRRLNPAFFAAEAAPTDYSLPYSYRRHGPLLPIWLK